MRFYIVTRHARASAVVAEESGEAAVDTLGRARSDSPCVDFAGDCGASGVARHCFAYGVGIDGA